MTLQFSRGLQRRLQICLPALSQDLRCHQGHREIEMVPSDRGMVPWVKCQDHPPAASQSCEARLSQFLHFSRLSQFLHFSKTPDFLTEPLPVPGRRAVQCLLWFPMWFPYDGGSLPAQMPDSLHIFQNHLTLTAVNFWGKADEQQTCKLPSSIRDDQGQCALLSPCKGRQSVSSVEARCQESPVHG